MKKKFAILLALLIVGGTLFFVLRNYCLPSKKAAVKRVQEFADLVDYHYNEPEKIYPYLTADLRSKISKEKFVEAFKKERSYPYLTPFFINYVSIDMGKDNKSGVATFSQAARLPGMIYKLSFVYENGNYYMKAFTSLADGSYLKKFDSIPNYLLHGWK